MTRDEYFATDWTQDKDIRAVDEDGTEFYFTSKPIIVQPYPDYSGWWQPIRKGEKYNPGQVADWWRESLQTKEQYLQLKNQSTNE